MRSILLLSLLVCISGCREIKVENGEIPDEYLEHIEPYLGDYQGEFNGRTGILSLQLNVSKLILSFVDEDGNAEILGKSCQSIIGNLLAFQAKKLDDDSYKVKNARFRFDPNHCLIEGRQIGLAFKKNIIKVRILKVTQHIPGSTIPPTCGKHGCTGGGKQPDKHIEHFIYGKFRKLN